MHYSFNRQRRAYLKAAATVPASSVVSPGLQSLAWSLLCLTMWGSVAVGDHSSKKWEKDVTPVEAPTYTLYETLAKYPAVRMHVCVVSAVWKCGFTSGCEGLSGLFALWSSLGKVVSILGGLRKRLSSCCWLTLRLWMMLHDCCCFCKHTHTNTSSVCESGVCRRTIHKTLWMNVLV